MKNDEVFTGSFRHFHHGLIHPWWRETHNHPRENVMTRDYGFGSDLSSRSGSSS